MGTLAKQLLTQMHDFESRPEIQKELQDVKSHHSIEEEAKLNEGTWALPDTMKAVQELRKLVSKPLRAKIASSKLYNLIGDDDLMDNIDDAERTNPSQDVRPLIASKLEQFVNLAKKSPNNFQTPPPKELLDKWEEIIKICNKA